ncbi:efflux RND transporter permease subunit [Auritidibacter ignavus]|uniref:Efflux RND transporter permease subunit n=1 Tax=Auritidibacter ignavus TaxID=678932 RepID=A0AAJ6ALW2_9MICC|nr:efflux RND transporter permease subunit [Auritidibacter ignavus]WGH92199.1 efflux RND transporter permease subunit [Auritidibacter ignavus]
MSFLPRLSLRNRAFIALVSIVITLLGSLSMFLLRRELIPPVELPAVAISAVNPGASSEQMADLVAEPLERELRTLDGLKQTSAISSSNFSMVTVELEYGTDTYRAASQAEVITNYLDDQLPEGTTTTVLSGGTGDIPAMVLSASSDRDSAELIADLELATIPDLQTIDGVASVQQFGGDQRIVRITPDDEAMATAGTSRTELVDSLEDAGVVLPGGTVNDEDDPSSEMDVAIGNELTAVEDLEQVLISTDENPVPLGDLAQVQAEQPEPTTVSRTSGQDGVSLLVIPAADANFIELSDQITQVLDESEEQLGHGTQFTVIFDQAPFIEESLSGLAQEGLIGLALAVVVIFGFLFAVRPTIISGLSIPLSVLFAFGGMLITDTTLNMMSVAGLMITIGRMVDDSIVVIENIVRHLKTTRPVTRAQRRATIYRATAEVASAVVSSTVVAMLVFAPVFFVSGLAGELFRPFAITVVLALLGSVLVALTIVPVLAYWFMRAPKTSTDTASTDEDSDLDHDLEADLKTATQPEIHEPTGVLARGYRPVLSLALSHRWITVALAIAVFLGSLALTPLLKVNLLGDSGMNMHAVDQTAPEGTSLQRTTELTEGLSEQLQQLEVVDVVQVDIGADATTGALASNIANYTLITDPEADQAEAAATIEQTVTAYREEHPEAGEIQLTDASSILGSSTVDVVLESLDDDSRTQANDLLVDQIEQLDSVERVDSDLAGSQPSVSITIDPQAAAEAGMTLNEVTGLITSYTTDYPVANVSIDGADLDVHLTPAADIDTIQELEDLDLGGIPLTDVADIERISIAPQINTSNAVRTVTLSATPTNPDDIGTLTDEITQVMDDTDLPEGVTAEIGGLASDIDTTFYQLMLAMVAAVLLIYVVLVWLFKSLIQPLVLLMSIPFGISGMILALLLTGTPIGAPAMIGQLMLIGIVVTNAIVLIDLVNQYRDRKMSINDALLYGGGHRIRPILMTAAATIGAMIPPALGLSGQSSFVSAPMAIAVIGGLAFSTVVTLIIVPVLYSLTERGGTYRRGEHASSDHQQ